MRPSLDELKTDLYEGANAMQSAFEAVAQSLSRNEEVPTVSESRRIGSIGPVNNPTHREAIERLAGEPQTFNPNNFRVVQYNVIFRFPDGNTESRIVTVFTDDTRYYYPHISSAD